MMCDECGIRPATIRLTTIVNGEKKDRNLCSECLSRSQKLHQDFSTLAGHLNGLLDALKSGISSGISKSEEKIPDIQCSKCGTTYEAFHKNGMLGCAQCYADFREELQNMLSRTQGHTQHIGRVPGGVDNLLSIKLKIERLRQELNRAIAQEEYEDAARLRDEIRMLQSRLDERSSMQ